MFENSNKQTQEKKSTLRCAPSLLFSHGEKLNTTQRGASQGGFVLFILFMSALENFGIFMLYPKIRRCEIDGLTRTTGQLESLNVTPVLIKALFSLFGTFHC